MNGNFGVSKESLFNPDHCCIYKQISVGLLACLLGLCMSTPQSRAQLILRWPQPNWNLSQFPVTLHIFWRNSNLWLKNYWKPSQNKATRKRNSFIWETPLSSHQSTRCVLSCPPVALSDRISVEGRRWLNYIAKRLPLIYVNECICINYAFSSSCKLYL